VVREALRLMEQQDQLRALQLQQLRRDIQDGLASGEPMAWNPEAIKAEGRALLQAWAPSNQDD
jgi:antitoxin ParD1/3/4